MTWEGMLLRVLTAVIGSGASLLGAYLLVLWNRHRWSGWHAVLQVNGVEVDRASLGWRTAKEWYSDPWARKLGLKSLCADNGRRLVVNVLKISFVDPGRRLYTVDLME